MLGYFIKVCTMFFDSHFPHPHTCILLQYPQKILKACLLGQGSGSPFPPKVTSSKCFSPLKKYQNLPSDLRFKYLWFPVAVMLHACPAFDKLTERENVAINCFSKIRIGNLSTLAASHRKKVVEPPEPYSRTFMSGFRIEHINSTPPPSNITVLKARKSYPDQNLVLKAFLAAFELVCEIIDFHLGLICTKLNRLLLSSLLLCVDSKPTFPWWLQMRE